ncbi:hypothetical protein BKA61DRAFT_42778 [Leptodontidium sp. MPI-SDFR-AT-0119]|nr:hypothetical protein BKA61DRAFT_42778 [Leptodontidium sp. MPI-SDFR-AT-0119]
MATFHPFPRLILELRAEIWALAVENRVVRVKLGKGFYSPSLVPAVTRVCRESRACCAYQKNFNVGSRGRHIWVNFDYDIIHVQASKLFLLPRESIKHLRIELVDNEGKEVNEEWMFDYKHEFFNFPRLESVDLLVPEELRFYAEYIDETYFGNCKKENVRVVSIETGEWIDEKTCAPYWDYIESQGGTDPGGMTRIAEETLEERFEDIKKLEMPRPRIALDYP